MKDPILTKKLKRVKKLIQPSSRWKKKTKAEIVEFAQKNPPKDHFVMPRFSKFALAFMLFLVLVILPTGTVLAQKANPGEPLYQIKRITEKARELLTTKPDEKDKLKQDFAVRRVDELEHTIEKQPVEIQQELAEDTFEAVEEVVVLEESSTKEEALSHIETKIPQLEEKTTSETVKQKIVEIERVLETTPTPSPVSTPSPQPVLPMKTTKELAK